MLSSRTERSRRPRNQRHAMTISLQGQSLTVGRKHRQRRHGQRQLVHTRRHAEVVAAVAAAAADGYDDVRQVPRAERQPQDRRQARNVPQKMKG